MQQILSMAQSLGAVSQEQPSQQQAQETVPISSPDPNLLQGILGPGNIDSNQKALLQALSPFLSKNRVQKLERAMQAARMAGTASRFLNNGGLQMLNGR